MVGVHELYEVIIPFSSHSSHPRAEGCGWGHLTGGGGGGHLETKRSCYPQNIGNKKNEEKHETYLKGIVSRQEYFLEDLRIIIIGTFCSALKVLQFFVSYLMKKSHSQF
jgi:hypothetical protein